MLLIDESLSRSELKSVNDSLSLSSLLWVSCFFSSASGVSLVDDDFRLLERRCRRNESSLLTWCDGARSRSRCLSSCLSSECSRWSASSECGCFLFRLMSLKSFRLISSVAFASCESRFSVEFSFSELSSRSSSLKSGVFSLL